MKFISLILIHILLYSCSSKSGHDFNNILTNRSNGKYWELIYQTDASGASQPVLVGSDSLPRYSLYFGEGQVIHYFIYNSDSVIDVNKISDDVVYTYDYWIKADTLNISGKSYQVKEITENSLILGWGASGRAIRVYRAGPYSRRVILDSLPSRIR